MWPKESRIARGYGPAWDKLREQAMQRDKRLCQVCLKVGRTTAAREVDHVVSKANAAKLGWPQEKVDSISNLQAICKLCHKVKTQEEMGKKTRINITIGNDGWPTKG